VTEAGFDAGRDRWLDRQGLLRNVVRQELVRRQLEVHLALPPASVLDVGAGQGTQAIHLARQGYEVVAVEPDPQMRAACEDGLAAEPAAVRGRIAVLDGSLETLDTMAALEGRTFDAVLCHGVLMYVDDPNPALRALGRRVHVDGIVSVVARNAGAMAWRHVLCGDFAQARTVLDEVDRSGWDRRDPRYTNELGVGCRADSLERLGAFFGGIRCSLEYWYGIRTFTDGVAVDTPVPEDPGELAEILAVEERLGRTEPYRRMGTLMHLVGRRGEGRGPVL